MKKVVGIYKIVSPSGKVYIGQSWDIRQRFIAHRSAGKKEGHLPINRSISKYGFSKHFFEIIHILPSDTEQSVLDAYEILYISQYKDCGIELLNLKEGGAAGGLCNEETKNKIRQSVINSNKNKVHFNSGRKKSTEEKERISKSRIGKYAGVNHPLFGKARTEEVKEKLRIANIGKKASDETVQKIKDRLVNNGHPMKGRKHSNESKMKMSASSKRRFNNG